MVEFLDSNLFNWCVLPLLIFLARVVDVSIGTVRIIFVSRGLKFTAALMGFFEILIWITVVTQVLQNLTNPLTYIAYAAGFATGNYIGILIEQRLSIGKVIIRIITGDDTSEMQNLLIEKGYRFTIVNAHGDRGEVKILFSVIDRKALPIILDTIKVLIPNAFYSIEDVRQVKEGEFPGSHRRLSAGRPFTRFRPFNIVKKK